MRGIAGGGVDLRRAAVEQLLGEVAADAAVGAGDERDGSFDSMVVTLRALVRRLDAYMSADRYPYASHDDRRMDVLTDVLDAHRRPRRARRADRRRRATGAGGRAAHPRRRVSRRHLGHGLARAPRGEPPRQLLPGDVVLLPHGTEHALGADRGDGRAHRPRRLERLRARRAAPSCGSAPATDPHPHPLRALRARPAGLDARCSRRSRTSSTSSGGALDDTVRLLGRELAAPQPATAIVLDRLVDILLVQLLRAWLDADGRRRSRRPGSARCATRSSARRWPAPRRPGARLDHRAARPTRSPSRARRSPAASRPRSARRPAAYLTRWRMDLAARRLRDTDDPLEAIARVGRLHLGLRLQPRVPPRRALPPGRYRAIGR